jgi:hypothetical protein
MMALALGLFWAAGVSAQGLSPLIPKPTFTASLDSGRFEAVAGEAAFVEVRLEPETPPPGYYVSTLVEVIEAPQGAKPKVVPGFPKIKLIFAEPGAYVLEIRVNMIGKSSCGGVEAEEVLREEVEFRVSGMDF